VIARENNMQRNAVAIAIAIAIALFLVPAEANAQAGASLDLFAVARWPAAIPPRNPAAVPVAPNFRRLVALTPGDAVEMSVAPGWPLTGTVTRVVHRSPTRLSILGSLDIDDTGFFIFVVEDDAIVGTIQTPKLNQVYRLGYVAGGVHEFEPVSGRRLGGCKTQARARGHARGRARGHALGRARGHRAANVNGLSAGAPPPSPQAGGFVPQGGCDAPLPNFDVMLYYTTTARIEAGGGSAMNAECQLAIDTTNLTYALSDIAATATLVYIAEVSYSESGDLEDDRDALADPDDGSLDNAHVTRDIYGGDFVVLMTSSMADSEACGIAYCTPSGAGEGFCVVKRNCASTSFSFPHELGHLQGCAHNRADAGTGCNEFCDSYGHRFTTGSGLYRTVMSYDTDPAQYTRIGWFSNPQVSFESVPTGADGDCDDRTSNAGTISATAPGRENWRSARFDVWVGIGGGGHGTFASPWPTVSQGAANVFGGPGSPLVPPMLTIKSGVYNESLTIVKPMTINSCGGIARVGG
jgi:hypothetical protein